MRALISLRSAAKSLPIPSPKCRPKRREFLLCFLAKQTDLAMHLLAKGFNITTKRVQIPPKRPDLVLCRQPVGQQPGTGLGGKHVPLPGGLLGRHTGAGPNRRQTTGDEFRPVESPASHGACHGLILPPVTIRQTILAGKRPRGNVPGRGFLSRQAPGPGSSAARNAAAGRRVVIKRYPSR